MAEARVNPFRVFSRALRDDRDAAAACRALQAREGLDVNLLLFCAWSGRHGHALTTGQIGRLRAASMPWQTGVTARLSGARACMAGQDGAPVSADDDPESLAAAIGWAEDEADRIEQNMLYRLLPLASGDPDVGAMVNNIHGYFGLMGRTPGPEDTADLVAIVLAALPSDVRALDLVRRFEEGRERGEYRPVE